LKSLQDLQRAHPVKSLFFCLPLIIFLSSEILYSQNSIQIMTNDIDFPEIHVMNAAFTTSNFDLSDTVVDRIFATENAPWRTDAIAPHKLSIINPPQADQFSIAYPPSPPRAQLFPSRALSA
jgi:hypothetical protein